MKIGIKSEIHDCTISIALLLSKNGIHNQNLISDVTNAKKTRIDTQYYVEKELNQTETQNKVEAARKFVLEIEQTIVTITPNKSITSEHN
jgi:hypothetical protein